MASFKRGNVVKLKSGGSKMTVVKVGELIKCMWFINGNSDLKTGSFRPDLLKQVSI